MRSAESANLKKFVRLGHGAADRESVVEELDVDFDTVFGCSRTSHRADTRSSAATAADHSTEVARSNSNIESGTVTVFGHRDRNSVRLVDDRTNEMFKNCNSCGSRHGAHPALEDLNCSIAPEISSNFATRSVG